MTSPSVNFLGYTEFGFGVGNSVKNIICLYIYKNQTLDHSNGKQNTADKYHFSQTWPSFSLASAILKNARKLKSFFWSHQHSNYIKLINIYIT